MEHVEVDIQELLQLQYEGVSVMNMFGKARSENILRIKGLFFSKFYVNFMYFLYFRVNVNLLLHLLNVKFYGRK